MSRSSIRSVIAMFLGFAFTAVAATGCGNSTDSSSSSEEYDCCLNGAYYQCDSQEEFETCNLSDETTCDRDPSQDDKCDE